MRVEQVGESSATQRAGRRALYAAYALWLGISLAACGSSGDTFVRVRLAGSARAGAEIARISADLSLEGKTATTELAKGGVTLPTDVVLAVRSGTGLLEMVVIAWDGAGTEIARGEGSIDVARRTTTSMEVAMAPSGEPRSCADKPCENGGTCTDGATGYSCTCAAGYKGVRCETNIDDCTPNPCENGGTCTDGVNSFSCACPAGFPGTTCSGVIKTCATHPCQNGATCADGANGRLCACAPGYTGVDCQTNIDDCSPNPCQNGGSCYDGVNSFLCDCVADYFGATCGAYCTAAGTCNGNGTCNVDTGVCVCNANWYGVGCSCNPSTTCSGHGTCKPSGACLCNTDWGGTNCDIYTGCNPSCA